MNFNFQDILMMGYFQYGANLLGALVVLLLGLWVVKILVRMLNRTLENSKMDATLLSFIKSVSSFLLKLILLITVAAVLGIPITTFVAVLSVAGLAVGLALKDSLSNFAGGVLILSFRPFNVGDFIETQGYMGTVKEINLLYTYLNTPDNRRVLIPNGELSTAKIVNYSTEDNRRIDLIFGVGYDDDIVKVKGILNNIVMDHPLILNEPEPIVRVMEHAESSINFTVRVWCKKEHYWDIYYDLHEEVKITFDNEGISIPFPQRDIHIYQEGKSE